MAIIDKPKDHFNPLIYSGNGQNATAISGLDFQPDWVWLKKRNSGTDHILFDAVRGVYNNLKINTTNAQAADSNQLQSFNSNGFTVGSEADGNASGGTYCSWNWKANGSGSNNTEGSQAATVSANTTAGFSIVKVVKSGTSVVTVGHGLNTAPSLIIGKSTSGTSNFITYHKSVGNQYAVYLNVNGGKTDSATFWNDTSPTSTLFTLGSDNSWNGTNIFYCFSDIPGYFCTGQYIGNGNVNGPFIYTGFKPAYIMLGNTTSDSNWRMMDNARNPINPVDKWLHSNNGSNEYTQTNLMNFVSNGVKIGVSGNAPNAAGQTYTYMVWAETPLVTSTDNGSIPGTAR